MGNGGLREEKDGGVKQEVILAGCVEVKNKFNFLREFWSLSSESASDQVSLESGLAALHGCA